jgi:hypothetical protein
MLQRYKIKTEKRITTEKKMLFSVTKGSGTCQTMRENVANRGKGHSYMKHNIEGRAAL